MRKLFFFLVLVAISIPAFAENIYVSQGGTGDGTSCSSPRSASWFNTSGNWGSGAGQINGGDTVYLCGTINSALTMQASGSSGAAITIDGASATLSDAINAPSRSYFTLRNIAWATGRSSRMLNLASSSNVTLTNLNLPGSLFYTQNAFIFDFSGASYLTLDGLTATPQGGLIIAGNYAHHITFSNMNVVTTNDYMACPQRDLIWTPTGSHDITIEKSVLHKRWSAGPDGGGCAPHNDIWQTWGDLDYVHGGTAANPYNYTLRYNKLITEVGGQGNFQFLMWEDMGGTTNIYGNVFISKNSTNNTGSVLTVFHDTVTANIYNNTFILKTTPPWFLWQWWGDGNYGVVYNVKNNIVYNETGGNGTISMGGGGTFNHTYNNYNGGQGNGYLGMSCTSYASTGEVCNSNPLFTNYANDDYRIGTNSPAYNTGTDLGSTYNPGLSTSSSSFPNPTLMGRPQATSWDKGAYEYTGEYKGGKVPLAPSNLGIK